MFHQTCTDRYDSFWIVCVTDRTNRRWHFAGKLRAGIYHVQFERVFIIPIMTNFDPRLLVARLQPCINFLKYYTFLRYIIHIVHAAEQRTGCYYQGHPLGPPGTVDMSLHIPYTL